MRGKQNVHFSALPVLWLTYTFLYGHDDTHMRQPLHRSWSTRTMPSSSRLYMAPDGQAATQAGLRQCSQMRGRWNMNVRSNSSRTRSAIAARFGSAGACSGAPPRSSSQFAPQVMARSSPVMADLGRMTGVCGPAGALSRVS
ncbi:hypothetical protein GCM10020220_033420 [Nonomuraea rubra]